MNTSLLAQGFIAAVNHVLARAPWACERLQPFAGRQFCLDATLLTLNAGVATDGLLATADDAVQPDVTLAIPLSEAPMILSGGMERLMNRVRITGNAEFAEALGFVFRNLSWDVEEDLSRVVGDISAHRIVGGMRSFGAMQVLAFERLGDNLSEYLTEEGRVIAARTEIDHFRDEVTQLRDAAARLEKRIARLPPRA